jgi:uncharacterized damage-inducible protein DinB
MITPGWVRCMAAYNSEMNRRWYAAAATLTDARRREDGGAFFGSIHATLCHLLWGDRMWMHRFDGWERPVVGIRESAGLIADFDELRAARIEADARIEDWAARLDPAWLEEELVWFSGATGRELRKVHWLLVTHLFNHQAHHRGQVHALLTRKGVATGDTDLPLV